jgi:LDH2 family malate/lactate/ureidoglycolate dehydrogenase
MPRFNPQAAETLTAKLAQGVGVPQKDAAILAHALVDADIHGISTHGLSRLNIYLQRIERGLITPGTELRVDRDGGSLLALDAGNGLGQVQAMKALEMLKPIARKNGIAAATIRNSQHVGALSYFCNLAAEQGFILLAMSTGEPAMSPAGGFEPFFGTNPIAASFPTGKGYPVKIDMATSIVARGNIIAAQKRGEPIPEGWALDPEGRPTTDAGQALLGTVLTMAGHKGYALAFMIEMFSSVLSGSAIGSSIGSMYKHMDRKQDVGHFFCLIHIDAIMDLATFKQRMDETIDTLKTGKRRPGVDEILIPGERSARKAATNRETGIALTPETVREIQQWCSRLNIAFELEEVHA